MFAGTGLPGAGVEASAILLIAQVRLQLLMSDLSPELVWPLFKHVVCQRRIQTLKWAEEAHLNRFSSETRATAPLTFQSCYKSVMGKYSRFNENVTRGQVGGRASSSS